MEWFLPVERRGDTVMAIKFNSKQEIIDGLRKQIEMKDATAIHALTFIYDKQVEDELGAFNDVFEMSKIENKKKIYVNDGDRFRSKDNIYEDVISFIENY